MMAKTELGDRVIGQVRIREGVINNWKKQSYTRNCNGEISKEGLVKTLDKGLGKV